MHFLQTYNAFCTNILNLSHDKTTDRFYELLLQADTRDKNFQQLKILNSLFTLGLKTVILQNKIGSILKTFKFQIW